MSMTFKGVWIIALVVLLSSFANAQTYIDQSHGQTLAVINSMNNFWGIEVSFNQTKFAALGITTFNITNFLLTGSDTMPYCYIFYNDTAWNSGNYLARSTRNGAGCVFNLMLNVNATRYVLAVGVENATAYNVVRKDTGVAFPYTNEYMTWTRNANYGATPWNYYTGEIQSILNVTLAFPAVPPPGDTPSLTLATSLNSDINVSVNPFIFYYNGTSVNNSNIYNCTFYVNTTLQETKALQDLSTNQNFTLDTSSMDKGYDFNVTCLNENATSSFKKTNIFIDTILPLNNVSISNNSILFRGVDTFINLTGFCSDSNLFSCNVTIYKYNADGTINASLNTSQTINISTTTFNVSFTKLISQVTDGKFGVRVISSDSHTKNTVRPMEWYFANNSVIADGDIKIDGDIKKLTEKGQAATYLYLSTDRYKFKVTFNDQALTHTFNLTTLKSDLYFMQNSYFKGHFVAWQSGHWIDFMGKNVKSVKVTMTTVNSYQVMVEHYTLTDEIEFESIGDLNVVTSEWYFNVTQNNYPFQVIIFDEENPSVQLPATLDVEFSYWVAGNPNKTTTNQEMTGASQYAFNVSTNVSAVDIDLYLLYKTTNGFWHRYIISNTTFNKSVQTNLTVFNFNTTTGISDLRLTLRQESNYNYYPNVICKLQRRYVAEGVWRTVQMDKSGDYGLCFFNIKEESTDYRLVFTDTNNNILKTTNQLKFSCTSGICDLIVLLSPYSAEAAAPTLSASYTYNNATKVATLSWSDASGGTNTMRLRGLQDTATGAYIVCDTNQTGAAGTATCNMTGRQGSVNLQVIGNGAVIYNDYIDVQATKLGILVGNSEGALWSVFLMVICASFGLFSPVGAIISFMLSLIFIYLFGLFTPLTITFLIIAACIGIVIGFKVRN